MEDRVVAIYAFLTCLALYTLMAIAGSLETPAAEATATTPPSQNSDDQSKGKEDADDAIVDYLRELMTHVELMRYIEYGHHVWGWKHISEKLDQLGPDGMMSELLEQMKNVYRRVRDEVEREDRMNHRHKGWDDPMDNFVNFADQPLKDENARLIKELQRFRAIIEDMDDEC